MQTTIEPHRVVRPDHSLVPTRKFKLFLLALEPDAPSAIQTLTAAGYAVVTLTSCKSYSQADKDYAIGEAFREVQMCDGIAIAGLDRDVFGAATWHASMNLRKIHSHAMRMDGDALPCASVGKWLLKAR